MSKVLYKNSEEVVSLVKSLAESVAKQLPPKIPVTLMVKDGARAMASYFSHELINCISAQVEIKEVTTELRDGEFNIVTNIEPIVESAAKTSLVFLDIMKSSGDYLEQLIDAFAPTKCVTAVLLKKPQALDGNYLFAQEVKDKWYFGIGMEDKEGKGANLSELYYYE